MAYAWIQKSAGNLDKLKLREIPLPDPEAGQARVKVDYCGLNLADVFAVLGMYSATPKGSFTPGLEYSGTIESLPGGSRTGFKKGDRVMGLSRFGGYSSHINADVRYLRKVPTRWSQAEAAAFPVQALTAFYGLEDQGVISRLGKEGTVFIHSGAGGVGLHAIQVCNHYGVLPIVSVGSDRKLDFLSKEIGLPRDQVIVRTKSGFALELDHKLKRFNRTGFDLVFDAIGAPYFKPLYKRLNPAGRLVYYGSANFMPQGNRPNYARLALQYLKRDRIDPLEMISSNRSVMGFNLIWLYSQVDRLKTLYDDMMQIKWKAPYIDQMFPFEKAPEALEYFKQGQNRGKVLLELP
ncbi:MAG: hypothetical protein CMN77_15390 [Spirochaetaceae bacterium]|nr:hypothetical protein [Spirochaetaceae bacterium]|tara:strand:+ start:188 stop:1237 length:1050 start_codon:yes stop_codon:yes gene_type:complete